MGAYAEAAHRPVQLAMVLFPPPSRHRPGDAMPACTYTSDSTSPDATVQPADAMSARFSSLDFEKKKKSDGRDPPQAAAAGANNGGEHGANYADNVGQPSLPEYQVIRHIVMPPVTNDLATQHITIGVQSPS